VKFTLHVENVEQLIVAARAAAKMAEQPPGQDLIGLTYGEPIGPGGYDASCRRNKAGITVWVRRVA
jgi:hypothetical protein